MTQSIVELGTELMDVAQKSSLSSKLTSGSNEIMTPSALGATILEETFNLHEPARGEILEQIFNRIVTNTGTSNLYISLLRNIVKNRSTLVSDFSSKFKESIEYLSFMSPDTGSAFLEAIQPLFTISRELQDYVVLVLRKAIFSRELDSRLVAMKGFLQLLRSGLQASAQPSSSQVSVFNVSEQLDYEILGFLRRCLTQQAEIRKALYAGLPSLLEEKPHLGNVIFDLLLNQFLQYYDAGDAAPFKLDKCVVEAGESVRIVEPFAHLLHCIQSCVTAQSNKLGVSIMVTDAAHDIEAGEDGREEDGDQVSFHKLAKFTKEFVVRLSQSKLADFELDDKADFSLSENKVLADILKGVYQVAMEFPLLVASSTELLPALDMVFTLFELYCKLKTTSREVKPKSKGGKGGAKGGKGRRAASEALPSMGVPLLSLEFVLKMFEALQSSEVRDSNLPISGNDVFDAYILNICHEQLSRKDLVGDFDMFANLGFSLLQHINILRGREQGATSGKPSKKSERSPMLTAVQCFDQCYRMASAAQPVNQITKYFDTIFKHEMEALEMTHSEDPCEALHMHTTLIEKMTVLLIEEEFFKAAEIFVHIVSSLTALCPQNLLPSHIKWVETLCVKETIQHPSLARALIAHCLQLCVVVDDLKQVQVYAQDLHVLLGDVARSESKGSIIHSIVNEATAPVLAQEILAVLDRLLEACEHKLHEVQLLAATTKHRLERDSMAAEEAGERRQIMEDELYYRMRRFVLIFDYILRSKTSGTSTEVVIKMCTKVYKFLTVLIKHNLVVKYKPGHQFKKLVDCVAEVLSSSTHDFIVDRDKDASSSKSKIGKESRLIPNLVFNMEQYERFAIKLSNVSKIDLTAKMGRHTARDFKILVEGLQKKEAEEEAGTSKRGKKKRKEMEEEEEEDQEEEERPKKKRRRSDD